MSVDTSLALSREPTIEEDNTILDALNADDDHEEAATAEAAQHPQIVIQYSSRDDVLPPRSSAVRPKVKQKRIKLQVFKLTSAEEASRKESRFNVARFPTQRSPSSTSRSTSSRRSTTSGEEAKKAARKKRKKKKKKLKRSREKTKLNIEVLGTGFASDATDDEASGLFQPPPPGLSPRSQAEYVRAALKKAAKIRKKRKRKRKKGDKEEDKKKRKKRRKGKKKRKKKKKKKTPGSDDTEEEEEKIVHPRRDEGHFYLTPIQLLRRRRLCDVERHPVQCSICSGVHYRTKRNFAANIRIMISVNRALASVLGEMRRGMSDIDDNLERVRRNLDYMERQYEGVFRRVNMLVVH